MRRFLFVPLWFLLAAPVMCPTRMQEPCDDRTEQWGAYDSVEEAQGGPWYDCNAGGGGGLLVAAAVIGVIARRRF
jgi:hypothetical protein